jgi:hypothetical protein
MFTRSAEAWQIQDNEENFESVYEREGPMPVG